jgi:hypothetical protein
MKLLHTADWQIGRVYGFERDLDGHDPSAAMATARFDVIATIAELATNEKVDAVLVAGDVFDKQALSDHSLRRVVNAMCGFSGRWSRLVRLDVLPPNVTLALRPGVLEFPDLRLAVLAAPLTQRQTHDDLTEFFDTEQTTAGLMRVGVAHGSVTGILHEGIDSTNPIAADRAATARLDYLALGDWHGTKQVDARTWYSGTPEQDRFKNNDPGNVLLVEIDEPGALPRVVPRRVGRFRWQPLALEINGSADVERLQDDLRDIAGDDVMRLSAAGTCDFASGEQLRSVIDEARARAHVLEADLSGLRLEPTAADLAAMRFDGALADVVDDLRQMQTQPEQAGLSSEALKLLFDLARREGVDA